MQVIDILLIDDEKEYCQSLRSRFLSIGEDSDLNIQVKGFQNLEEGFAELEKDGKYKAVILDAKALIKTDQETADLDFLPVALHRLEKLNQKTGRIHTPFAVITGYYDNFLSFDTLIKEQKGKLFDKSSQEEEMLQYLLNEIESSENTKIEKQYADVFEVFEESHLDAAFRTHLLKLLKTSNSDDPTEIKKNLALLRSLQEQIFQTLNKKDKQIVPDSVINSFRAIHRHLSGNKDKNRNYQTTTTVWQNNWIENLSECLYEVTSDNGSHNPYDNTPLPTKYAVQSLTFAFLEQLLWFKKLMN